MRATWESSLRALSAKIETWAHPHAIQSNDETTVGESIDVVRDTLDAEFRRRLKVLGDTGKLPDSTDDDLVFDIISAVIAGCFSSVGCSQDGRDDPFLFHVTVEHVSGDSCEPRPHMDLADMVRWRESFDADAIEGIVAVMRPPPSKVKP